MAEDEAIWYVIAGDAQQGPLTKDQVLEFLRSGQLAGSDLIWSPGFRDWKSVSEVDQFWRPPLRKPEGPAQSQSPANADHIVNQPPPATNAWGDKKWSLWRSGSLGLGLSVLLLITGFASDGRYQLASYAHTRNTGTLGHLMGQILVGPVIFVFVALIRNLFNWRQPRSSTSAVKGALIFATLLAAIFAVLFVYGDLFFSSTELISGAARKEAVTSSQHACVQKARSTNQAVTDAQIQSFCTCYSEKMADIMTYKMVGDLSTLADPGLRQKAEAAASACR